MRLEGSVALLLIEMGQSFGHIVEHVRHRYPCGLTASSPLLERLEQSRAAPSGSTWPNVPEEFGRAGLPIEHVLIQDPRYRPPQVPPVLVQAQHYSLASLHELPHLPREHARSELH